MGSALIYTYYIKQEPPVHYVGAPGTTPNCAVDVRCIVYIDDYVPVGGSEATG